MEGWSLPAYHLLWTLLVCTASANSPSSKETLPGNGEPSIAFDPPANLSFTEEPRSLDSPSSTASTEVSTSPLTRSELLNSNASRTSLPTGVQPSLQSSASSDSNSQPESPQSTPSLLNISLSGFTSSTARNTPSPLPRTCAPAPRTVGRLKGYVQWTGDPSTDCEDPHTWQWPLPPDVGVVFHLHLRRECSIRLYEQVSVDGQSEMKEVHIWPGYYVFPIAVVQGEAVMKVQAMRKNSRPTFNISYEVYPVSWLPQKIDVKSQIASSMVMFNCSPDSPVPEALACDGVKHCVGDEDEEGCEYRSKGCGDWLPYRQHCLKLDVLARDFHVVGHTPITTPIKAGRECQTRYGATLAALPDAHGRKLVAAMLYKSGITAAAISLRKVNPVSKKQRHLYRYTWQWGTKGSPIAYEEMDIQEAGMTKDCAMMSIVPDVHFVSFNCLVPDLTAEELVRSGYVCTKPNPDSADPGTSQTPGVHLTGATRQVHQVSTKRCADGSVVQMFHQCQWQGQELSTQWSPNHFPLFQCQYGPPVHYTVVCDGLQDCADGSDEVGCLFPRVLRNSSEQFVCENYQVIPRSHQCDGVADCFDSSDEVDCVTCSQSRCTGAGCIPWWYVQFFSKTESCTYLPPVLMDFEEFPSSPVFFVHQDGFGMSSFKYVSESDFQGYFSCKNGRNIPTYLLNNGELDCLGGEDEHIPPDNFICPGFYRCQVYGNCVHADFVCDGVAHCPNKDDERYCGLSHPSDCTCEGYACSCHTTMPGPLADLAYLRYLDLSGLHKPSLDTLFMLSFLRFLNASFCRLSSVTFVDMPQLEILDLSHNALWGLSSLVMKKMTGLTHLNLSGNPLVPKLDATFSSFFQNAGSVDVQHLVLKDTHIRDIEDNAFRVLHRLNSLDLSSNKLEHFSRGMFEGLISLTVLQADDPRLCCSYFHPQLLQCTAPHDELSSCNDLLRSDFFRALLWALSLLTTLGNVAVFVYKAVILRKTRAKPYQVFVSHLCVADFLMGVYMAMVGAADTYFRGSYVANERRWKQSGTCFAAGFLAFVSSEVSVFMICLITLDRLLMLCFPFKPQLHMTAKFSMALCCVVWALGLLLAAVPVMGQFEFYGESSVCLPLPITRHQFSGQTYAFVVFIVLNFLLFLFIGTGQLAIYWAVHRARAAVNNPRQEEQTSIARRLFLVVFTDFCCWFPVGLMGILASAGVPIPGVVSVWAAVIVLPLNSALNPFLYTLNSLREKWNIRKINQKSQRFLFNLKGEIPKLAPGTMEEMTLIYLRSNKSVKLDKVLHFLQCQHDDGHNGGQARKTLGPQERSTCQTQNTSAE